MQIVYISGSITNGGKATSYEMEKNVAVAKKVALELWKIPDLYVICPHLNIPLEIEKSYDEILQLDLEFLNNVDFVFMMLGWKKSKGAVAEYEYAKHYGIPIMEENTVKQNIESLKNEIAVGITDSVGISQCRCCGKTRLRLNKTNGICIGCGYRVAYLNNTFKQQELVKFIPIPRNP